MDSDNQLFSIAGGLITCRQCAARSKRTKLQCRAPAMRGKAVCRTHGGLSTGPKTPEGRQRCADVRTVHGRETRAIRKERQAATARLQELEELARHLGLIGGPKARGRKVRRD